MNYKRFKDVKSVHFVQSLNESTGIGVAAYKIAQHQSKYSNDVQIFTCSPFSQIKIDTCGRKRTKKSNFFRFLTYIFTSRDNDYFFFHGIWCYQWILFFPLICFAKKKYLIAPHGNLEKEALNQKRITKKFALRVFFRYFIKSAFKVVVFSEKEKKSAIKYTSPETILCVKLGVDLPASKKISHGSKDIILYVGRLDPLKGLAELIDAYASLKNKKWPLVVVGDGPVKYKNFLLNKIEGHNLSHLITLPGKKSYFELSFLFSKARFFVLPSKSESFGLVVAEALAYSVPVLTTSCTPWVTDSPFNGCKIVTPTVRGILNGMNSFLCMDHAELIELGKKGRLYVKKNYRWGNVAKKIYGALN